MPWVSRSTPLDCQSDTRGNEDRTRQTPRRASVRRRATATVGSAAADAHKTAATIATDARIRITIRMTWYWSHLLRSLLQSPGSAFKSQAATRWLIGTRQISENGTVTASKAADDKDAHQDQLPVARVNNEAMTKSNAAAYQNGMTLPSSRASVLAASA